MDNNVIIVSVTTGILGLLSVVLGFAAEATRIKPSQVFVYYRECYYPTSPAYGLAIGAALFLLVSKIILSVFFGCCGCCQTGKNLATSSNVLVTQAGNKRTVAIIMISFSWVAFAIAFILFCAGANANGTGGGWDYSCVTVLPGIFAGGSILSLATIVLGIGAYFLLRSNNGGPVIISPGVNPGIAVAAPQFPPQVFVQPSPQVFVQPNPQGFVQPQMQQGHGHGQAGVPNTGAQPGYGPAKQGAETQEQNYYPPPGTTPHGYGHNTETNM